MQITFPSALLLLFIGLKLSAIIDWSWFWVFSPIWGTFIIVLLVGFLAIMYASFCDSRSKVKRRNKK